MCVMDAVMPEPDGTWKTSPRQIKVQTWKGKSDCIPAGRCCWRSVTSQATLPRCRKMLWDVPLASSMVPGVAGRQVSACQGSKVPQCFCSAQWWGHGIFLGEQRKSQGALRCISSRASVWHKPAVFLYNAETRCSSLLSSVSLALLSTPPFSTHICGWWKKNLLLHNKILRDREQSAPSPESKPMKKWISQSYLNICWLCWHWNVELSP